MNLLKCDKLDCPNTTSADHPGFGWVKLEALSEVITPAHIRERHYCSMKCVHAHTYLLISGDNGK